MTFRDHVSDDSSDDIRSLLDETNESLRTRVEHDAENKTSKSLVNKHRFAECRKLLLQSPAYSWLITSLRRELILVSAKPNLMESIRREIHSVLPTSHSVSGARSPEVYTITYRTNWNPLAFFKQQNYREGPGNAVETAITLTGSTQDAQALGCAQYLYQTWPFTGKDVMHLLKKLLRDVPGRRHTRKSLKCC